MGFVSDCKNLNIFFKHEKVEDDIQFLIFNKHRKYFLLSIFSLVRSPPPQSVIYQYVRMHI